jgi:hypothetical protein
VNGTRGQRAEATRASTAGGVIVGPAPQQGLPPHGSLLATFDGDPEVCHEFREFFQVRLRRVPAGLARAPHTFEHLVPNLKSRRYLEKLLEIELTTVIYILRFFIH